MNNSLRALCSPRKAPENLRGENHINLDYFVKKVVQFRVPFLQISKETDVRCQILF